MTIPHSLETSSSLTYCMQNRRKRDHRNGTLVHHVLPSEESRHLAEIAERGPHLIQIVRRDQRRLNRNAGVPESCDTRRNANVSATTVPATACRTARRWYSRWTIRSWRCKCGGFYWPLLSVFSFVSWGRVRLLTMRVADHCLNKPFRSVNVCRELPRPMGV